MPSQFECVECHAPIQNHPRGRFRLRCGPCQLTRQRAQSREHAASRKAAGYPPLQKDKTAKAKAEKANRRAESQAKGCRICQKPLKGMQLLYCSARCGGMAYLDRIRPEPDPITCAECTKSFIPRGARRKFCSRKCLYRLRDREQNGRRRRVIAAGEKIRDIDVLERDGWTCQECFIQTPSSLRGTKSPFAPVVDHIISIADGGQHVMTNLQCLCFSCNSRKGRHSGRLNLICEEVGSAPKIIE